MSEVWIQPTGCVLGADVHGVDLAKPVSEAVFRHIAAAWSEHLVLRFAGQRIDDRHADAVQCTLRPARSTRPDLSSQLRSRRFRLARLNVPRNG